MSSYTNTLTESTAFTRVHARHITARIAADLARLTAFYPTRLTELRINQFQEEAIEYLKAGYLESVTFGFRKVDTDYFGDTNIEWVLALKYVVNDGELDGGSSSPGGIQPGIDIEDAKFYSFLVTNYKFSQLSPEIKDEFEKTLPIFRGTGKEPGGSFRQDRAYGQGGRYVNRLICGY